jgi:hypothetical protein
MVSLPDAKGWDNPAGIRIPVFQPKALWVPLSKGNIAQDNDEAGGYMVPSGI